MKTRLLVTGVLCLGLALYYVSFEMPGPVEKKREERLFPFGREDISGIEIRGDALISLVKKGQTWWVEGQVNFPADRNEVGALIRNLINIPVKKTLEGPEEDFGLDKPAMEIGIRTTRGLCRLSLGSDSPTSSFCYASVQGRKGILLLPAGTRELFRKSLFSLTDRYLIHVNPRDVSRVRVVKHGSILEFVRDGAGGWCLAGGSRKKLGAEKVNDFFRNICGIRALSFPENGNTPGNPDVTVELTSSRGVQKLRMWKEGQKVYALSDYQRGKAEVSAPLLLAIPSGPDDLLDRSVAGIAGSAVRKVSVEGKGGRVFLMNGGQWYDGKKRVENGAVLDHVIRTLSSLEYEDEYLMLPRDAGAGLRLRVYTDPGAAPFDIILYSQYYVAVGKRVFRINEGDMKDLKESLHKLLSEYQ